MDKLKSQIQAIVQPMIQQGIDKYMGQKQFNLSKIQSHDHDGVVTNKLYQKNIIPNQKTTVFITASVSEDDVLDNVVNFTRIDFYGFVANNAGGGAATKRAICNGTALVGNCFRFISSSQTSSGTTPIPIIMSSNAFYSDTSSLAKQSVAASNEHFIYATDDTGTVIVQTSVTYTSSSITFSTTLAAGYKLQGSIVIS